METLKYYSAAVADIAGLKAHLAMKTKQRKEKRSLIVRRAKKTPARRLLDVELRRDGRPEATVRLQARHRHGPLQRRQAVEGILRRRSGEPLAAQRQALLHEERRRDFDAKDGVGSGPKPIGPVPARMSTPPSGPGGDTRVK